MWETIWVISSIGCGVVITLALCIALGLICEKLENKFGPDYHMFVWGALIILFLACSVIMAPISYVMKSRTSSMEVEAR